jgi:D-alanine--poly(phosphoribitol) ligase subunit 1
MTAAGKADVDRIARFNRTERAFPDNVTVQQLIEAEVDRRPLGTAVICDHDDVLGARSLTYGQLNERVNQLAHRLWDEGVGPGDVVALMVERSFAMIIGILGIVRVGAAYLPVSTDNPPDRVDYMLKDAGVKVVLVHNKTAKQMSAAGPLINLDDPRLYRGPTTNLSNINTPRDLAYVIYTSGSTGRPKGVMIEHRSLVNRLHWMQHAYPIDSGDVILVGVAGRDAVLPGARGRAESSRHRRSHEEASRQRHALRSVDAECVSRVRGRP